VKLALFLPAIADRKWKLARQIGINYAVTKAAPELTGAAPPYDLDSLAAIQARFAEAGLTLHALEGDEFDMGRIKLGLPGRDEDIERYRQMLRNMGRLGIPVLCLNFMAQIGWFRTSTTAPGRGGALTSAFDYDALKDAPLTPAGVVPEVRVWENFAYFIRAVAPAAQEAGVRMALHPDDPPISPLRGISRILTSAAAYERALGLADSPAVGIAFCQANFRAMGEDVPALVRRWAKRIFFVHFRDIRGDARRFEETFHDEGPTDMPAMLKLYHEVGFAGLIRPDHAPTMEGEENLTPGYEIMGRMFAIGYMKGIMHTLKIPLE